MSNSVSILSYGGVLAGWARIDPPGAADFESVQAQDGWLQIAPFISGPRLHARTQAVDLLVIPGGHPVAGVAVRPGPLWRSDGQPAPPAELRLHLVPEIHMTRLHEVNATATLRFAVRHLTGAHERWQCSVATNFTLVDRSAGLPDLWILRYIEPRRSQRKALALYSRHRGAFEAVFLDPETAHAFALWEAATHAARAGRFALGLIGPQAQSAFAPISVAESGALTVAQWGAK